MSDSKYQLESGTVPFHKQSKASTTSNAITAGSDKRKNLPMMGKSGPKCLVSDQRSVVCTWLALGSFPNTRGSSLVVRPLPLGTRS
jgi:hypothetical protein